MEGELSDRKFRVSINGHQNRVIKLSSSPKIGDNNPKAHRFTRVCVVTEHAQGKPTGHRSKVIEHTADGFLDESEPKFFHRTGQNKFQFGALRGGD
jgi:hypothetical protein